MSDAAAWSTRPTLAGDLVTLVPLERTHAADLLRAADDDAVFTWLTIRRPGSVEEVGSYIDGLLDRFPHQVAWAQTVTATGEIAGVTSFYEIDPEQRSLAIGHTWLGRRFWRTGLNREAKLLLLQRAFDDLGCVRVAWHTDDCNTRSQRAIEDLGATREGVLRKHKRRPDGSWRDTVTYSLLDSEWTTARESIWAR